MKCVQCESDISPHLTECSQCGFQLGYPNVRKASGGGEVNALSNRYDLAVADASARSCGHVSDEFETWVTDRTRPVICRWWGTIAPVLSKDHDLFRTFYELIDAGDREPYDNEFDQARQAVDATFFPYFYQKVNFAALSGDGRGPSSYGDCHFTFKESSISHRTTVFEENTVIFCRKHRVIAGERPPEGFLATWEKRGRLAVVKLVSKLGKTTQTTDFPSILLLQTGKTDTDEFIECHIFGKLTISNVESFRARTPKRKADRVLAKRIRRKLQNHGISESPL